MWLSRACGKAAQTRLLLVIRTDDLSWDTHSQWDYLPVWMISFSSDVEWIGDKYEYQRNRIIVLSTTMVWHTYIQFPYFLFFTLCSQMSFSASDSALVFASHSANSYSLFSPTFDLTTPAVPTASQDSNIGKINL